MLTPKLKKGRTRKGRKEKKARKKAHWLATRALKKLTLKGAVMLCASESEKKQFAGE